MYSVQCTYNFLYILHSTDRIARDITGHRIRSCGSLFARLLNKQRRAFNFIGCVFLVRKHACRLNLLAIHYHYSVRVNDDHSRDGHSFITDRICGFTVRSQNVQSSSDINLISYLEIENYFEWQSQKTLNLKRKKEKEEEKKEVQVLAPTRLEKLYPFTRISLGSVFTLYIRLPSFVVQMEGRVKRKQNVHIVRRLSEIDVLLNSFECWRELLLFLDQFKRSCKNLSRAEKRRRFCLFLSMSEIEKMRVVLYLSYIDAAGMRSL